MIAQMIAVWIQGGPAPMREALEARFIQREIAVLAEAPSDDDVHRVVGLLYCVTDDDFRQLAAQTALGLLGQVAVLERLDPALYRRALQLGCGAVHLDTSTEIIAEVVIAAAQAEALIPIEIARRLMGPDDTLADGDGQLDFIETELLRAVAHGETIVSVADRFHYSERTIRRRLQSAFVKLGVENRAEAIRTMERRGLL